MGSLATKRYLASLAGLLVAFLALAPTELSSKPPLSEGVEKKISAAAQAFLMSEPRNMHVPGSVALDCLATIALVPDYGEPAIRALRRRADVLVGTADMNHDGQVGWYFDPETTRVACDGPGTSPSLVKGVCNPRFTKYTYQTALAATCLAKSARLLRDQRYLTVAIQAIQDSWEMGTAGTVCPDCFYYWYSYVAAERGRYIRNVNALMGMAVASLFSATGEERFKTRASAVARSERREIVAGNRGYFGIDDETQKKNPALEKQRVENHVPLVAKGLLEIGTATGNAQTIHDAEAVMRTWLFCEGTFCDRSCDYVASRPECKRSVTVTPCFFVQLGEPFIKACQAAALQTGGSVGAYELWALFDN